SKTISPQQSASSTMPKIAVIGAGRWGKNHVRTFHQLGVLGAVIEVDARLREAMANEYPDIPIYDCIDPILSDPALIGASVATPAETHYEIAKRLLLAGKHALIEKPITLFSRQAEELDRIAREKKLVLMVGHVLLYHPAVQKMKSLIVEGRLGTLQYIYSNRLNLGTVRKEENALWSFAPHDIAVINYLVGMDPVSVDAKGGVFLQPGIHDVTVTHLLYPKNIVAHIHVSWLHPFKEQRLVVIGDKSMVVFEDSRATDKLILYPKGIDWVSGNPVARDGGFEVLPFEGDPPLTAECRHFIDCIAEGRTPLSDGANGVAVLKVLEKAQEALTNSPNTTPAPKAEERPYFVHPSAYVDDPVEIGKGTKIWHFSHVMKNVKIGERCSLGQNVNIDSGVIIGNNVKVQNNVSLYTGLIVEDDVFLGPSCVTTNVTNPRSQILRHSLYEKTLLKRGCSIGANATVVCGITVGRYAFVGSGAVVTKNVPDYAMMMGVPAKQVGWVSRHGLPLRNPDQDGIYTCPESGLRYQEIEKGVLRCLDIDEEAPLPEMMRHGETFYDDIVHPGERLV
ncbi:MAG: Gfo/Idh/MocA family oxidoreductase, partial [Calditrichota bacterium]